MNTKVAAVKARATTYRLEPKTQAALVNLSKVLRRPMNVLVNQALQAYLDQQLPKVEQELETTLARLRTYREHDPTYERAIGAFADAEARFEDDLEGQVIKKERSSSTRNRRPSHA